MNQEKYCYNALIWHGVENEKIERITFFANDLDDAKRELRERYGEDVKFSLYNENDAGKAR